jgi:hypothetical protein
MISAPNLANVANTTRETSKFGGKRLVGGWLDGGGESRVISILEKGKEGQDKSYDFKRHVNARNTSRKRSSPASNPNISVGRWGYSFFRGGLVRLVSRT